MTGRVTKIERVAPRGGIAEEPAFGQKGYRLGDPKHGAQKHLAENAVFAKTLDEVAELIAKGYSLWMGRPGKRPSLVSPGSLRILR